MGKIILLSELLGVTTAFFVKDDIKLVDSTGYDVDSGVIRDATYCQT